MIHLFDCVAPTALKVSHVFDHEIMGCHGLGQNLPGPGRRVESSARGKRVCHGVACFHACLCTDVCVCVCHTQEGINSVAFDDLTEDNFKELGVGIGVCKQVQARLVYALHALHVCDVNRRLLDCLF